MPDGRREAVRCTCGQMLVDDIDPPEVQVGEDRFRFRRTTDYVVCPACDAVHRITDLGGVAPSAREVVEELSDLSGDE